MTGLCVIHHSILLPLLIVPSSPSPIPTLPPSPFLGPGTFEKILDPPLHNKGIFLVDVFISVAAVEKHNEFKTQNHPKWQKASVFYKLSKFWPILVEAVTCWREEGTVTNTARGSFENEALENEARSTQNSKTKHPNLENEAPYLENEAPYLENEDPKISKTKHPKLENEDP